MFHRLACLLCPREAKQVGRRLEVTAVGVVQATADMPVVVSAIRVVPYQDCRDRSAFFRRRGVDEEAPDSGRLNFGKPSGRSVEPPSNA
jgi:hypothetical protein